MDVVHNFQALIQPRGYTTLHFQLVLELREIQENFNGEKLNVIRLKLNASVKQKTDTCKTHTGERESGKEGGGIIVTAVLLVMDLSCASVL